MRYLNVVLLILCSLLMLTGCSADEEDDEKTSYNSRLIGDYVSVFLDASNNGMAYGLVNFDGNGSGTFTNSGENKDGAFDSQSSFTYTVLQSGIITAKSGSHSFKGAISNDNSLAAYSGSGIFELNLKASTSLSNSDLSGDYIALVVDISNDSYGTGTVSFNGDGSGIYDYNLIAGGSPLDVTGDFSYDVSADGRISATSIDSGDSTADAVNWYGIASEDGTIVGIVGNQQIEIIVKNSTISSDPLNGFYTGVYIDTSSDSESYHGIGTAEYDGNGNGDFQYEGKEDSFNYTLSFDGTADTTWQTRNYKGVVEGDGGFIAWGGTKVLDFHIAR